MYVCCCWPLSSKKSFNSFEFEMFAIWDQIYSLLAICFRYIDVLADGKDIAETLSLWVWSTPYSSVWHKPLVSCGVVSVSHLLPIHSGKGKHGEAIVETACHQETSMCAWTNPYPKMVGPRSHRKGSVHRFNKRLQELATCFKYWKFTLCYFPVKLCDSWAKQ